MTTCHVIANALPYELFTDGKVTHNPVEKVPGAYCITHAETGKVYIGSTSTLGLRARAHESSLRRGIHRNPNLQAIYNEDPTLEVVIIPTTSIDDARALEQRLVDEFKDTGFLCNIGVTDVTRPGLDTKYSLQQRQLMSERRHTRVTKDTTRVLMTNTRKAYYQTEKGQEQLKTRAYPTAKHITVNGVEYPSISEAARQLNTTQWKISHGTYMP